MCNGRKLMPVPVANTRAEIPQTTVRYSYMIEPGTGYLAISDFSRSTGDEVARAILDRIAQSLGRDAERSEK